MKWAKLGKKIGDWRSILVTAPTVAGLVIALRLTGLLQVLEWAALDQFFRSRPIEPVDERIVIVAIDEADLKRVGKWPIPDVVMADLLLKITAQQPKAIGLDIYRDLPVEPGHADLVKVFETTPNLIGIEKVVGRERDLAVAPSPVLSKKGQIGSNDVVVDADGRVRRGILYLNPANRDAIASLGFRLAMIYLEADGITPEFLSNGFLKLGKQVFVPFESNDGAYVKADAGGYQILLNFRGGTGSFATVSMTDVLENRVSADLLRDRIVYIGPTAASLKDFFYTPYSGINTGNQKPMSGVELQAHLTSQILSSALQGRPGIKTWADPLEYGWIFLWSCIGASLAWKLPSWQKTTACLIIAGGSLMGGSYLAFLSGWWIPLVPAFLSLIGAATSIETYVAQKERKERKIVMNLFGRHVSPQIAEAIWQDRYTLMNEGRIKGQKLTATVLFTDLKNFSTAAEYLDPEELMNWLNEYMEAMSRLVLSHGGVVDKFIGDAVMAVFGVPIPRTTDLAIAEDAKAAVRCALEMGTTLEELNQVWRSQGRPTVAMRVGIATGTIVAGSLGGSQRLEYTAIGDTVNVAARLESHDKSIDGGICRILINAQTYEYISQDFSTKLIGKVQLKGREQLTPIYQVLPNNSDQ